MGPRVRGDDELRKPRADESRDPVLYVRRPPLCWLASHSDSAGLLSPGLLDLARAFRGAAVGRGGSDASRASRSAFSLAMLSSTAFVSASRSVLPDLASAAALVTLFKRASA
jgi:hypothetical protein